MKTKYDLYFTKMVAAGNDFVIIDNKSGELDVKDFDYSAITRDVCRRKFSVGADGLLLLEASPEADYRMRIFNPDGGEVDMCGNGARCSALYASLAGWGDELTIETAAGLLKASVSSGKVKLKMSDPKDLKLDVNLGIGSNMILAHSINTGVPHVVHFVDDLESYNVKEVGKNIRYHSMFAPDGTNANFIGDIAGSSASVRTYERGVEDETLACGTGSVASAIIMGLTEGAKSPVSLTTRSGDVLTIHYKLSGKKVTDVYLEGGAQVVSEGKL